MEGVEGEGREGRTRELKIKGIIHLQKRGRTNWVLGRRRAKQNVWAEGSAPDECLEDLPYSTSVN